MSQLTGSFRFIGNRDILPFLSHPQSSYSNARVIRPHLQVRYYRGIDLLTTDQFKVFHPDHYRQFELILDMNTVNFWTILSVNPNCPKDSHKKGRRTYSVFPLEPINMAIDGHKLDTFNFNMDQVIGMMSVTIADIYCRDFRIDLSADISGLVANTDTETRADFYLAMLSTVLRDCEVLKSMPGTLMDNPVVSRRAFSLVAKVLDLLNIQKDSMIWERMLKYLDSPHATMEAITQQDDAQHKLDAVTKEIMEMQAKKDAGLWTDEDEAYVNSL